MSKQSKPAPRAPHRTPSGRASRARIIEATTPSKCFSSLTYERGVGVVAEFAKDGSVHVYPISRAEALSWFDADSLGREFNEQIR